MQMTVHHITFTTRNLLRTLFLVCVNCYFRIEKRSGRKVEPNPVLNDTKLSHVVIPIHHGHTCACLGLERPAVRFERKNLKNQAPSLSAQLLARKNTSQHLPSLHDAILSCQCSGVVGQASTHRRTRSLSGVFW